MKKMMFIFSVSLFMFVLTPMANSQFVKGVGANVNGSYGLVGINDELPENATLVNKGEVVSVNPDDHTVTVRGDSSENITNVYSITNKQMLGSVNQGDSIKIFSQPATQVQQ